MAHPARHRLLVAGTIVWWILSAALLAWTLAQPELGANERHALKALLPLYLLGLPLSHLGLRATNMLSVELYVAIEFIPSIFTEGVWLWGALALCGWLQWFVLVPLFVRLVRHVVRRPR